MADAKAGLTPQDYGNILGGLMIASATFMIGKIAVSAIMKSRKEHFDAKGQPPAAVKAKETRLDGIIKTAGAVYSGYCLKENLAEILSALKSMGINIGSP